MQSYVFVLILAVVTSTTQLIQLPTTYYLQKLAYAPVDSIDALYFKLLLCPNGIAGRTRALLQIFAPENPEWDTNKPWIAVQVSKCKDTFTAACTIQNYLWGSYPQARSNISWDITNNVTDYFIRVMAPLDTTKFSIELSFTDALNQTFSFPGTEGKPFDGTQISSTPAALDQYWVSKNLFRVENNHPNDLKFQLAYCDQGTTISGIDVALSTLTYNISDYSLVQQWACSTATKVDDCTYSNYDWRNPHTASFSTLRCDNQEKSTKNGIIVGVEADGANLDNMNTIVLSAATYT